MLSAEPVCSCAFSLCMFAHETAGAARTRSSLRPLKLRGRNDLQTSGASCREIAKSCNWSTVIARSTCDEAIHSFFATRWLAMTVCHPELLRRLRRFPEHPRRRRKAARRAVGDLDLILPGQAEGAGDHVLHEGVGTIHRAALHRDIAAVPELVDVVLDAPVDPGLAHQIGRHLTGHDPAAP